MMWIGTVSFKDVTNVRFFPLRCLMYEKTKCHLLASSTGLGAEIEEDSDRFELVRCSSCK
jgi:hypothetical protein